MAPNNIAGQASLLARSLRSLGIDAWSVSFSPSKIGYPVDELIVVGTYYRVPRFLLKLPSLIKLSSSFDVFHFHGGQVFLGETDLFHGLDLEALKFFGRTLIMHFHGSEIRNPDYVAALGRKYRTLPPISTDAQISRVNFLKGYVDKFVVATPDLIRLVPGSYYLPDSVGEEWFSEEKFAKKRSNEFVVVHAPTRRKLKGTDYIIEACRNLRKKGYDIRLRLVENVPNDKVRKIYSEADVFVDQLLIGWYGVAAIENMAMGNPVVAYVEEELKSKYAPDLPIISASKKDIQDVLESLVRNRVQLSKSRMEFRNYALKYHHSVRNARKLLEIYKS